jgi:hypothetical protein
MKTPLKLAMIDLFYGNFSGSIIPSNSFLDDFSSRRRREVFATLQSVPAVGERCSQLCNQSLPSARGNFGVTGDRIKEFLEKYWKLRKDNYK